MFAVYSPFELNVLGHDRDPLGMDGTQVDVLKQTHQIRFYRLLKCKHLMAEEPQVRLLKINTRSLIPFGVKLRAKKLLYLVH